MRQLPPSVVAVIVVIVLTGLMAHGSNAGTGDAAHYMQIARSVAFDRDLDLTNDYSDQQNLIQTGPEAHAVPGRDGRLRPVHDVGLPVVVAPAFAVAYWLAERSDWLPEGLRRRLKLNPSIALRQLVSLIVVLLTACAAYVFQKADRDLTGEHTVVAVWALLWALSPPILTNGYVFFTEVPSALVALLCYWRRDDVSAAQWRVRGLLLGALTGFLILLHVRNIGLVVALVGLTVWRVRREPRRLLPYAAGLSLMAALKLMQNYVFWGTLLTTPHDRLGEWMGVFGTLNEMTMRAGAMLFDGAHGLLLSAPIYLLTPAAFIVLWRRSRPIAAELALLVAAYLFFVLLPMTNAHGWHGGWAPAARFLVPVTPFLALPVTNLLATARSRVLIGGVVAIQLIISAYIWLHPMLSWAGGEETSAWLTRLAGERAASMVPIWPIVHPFDAASWKAFLAGAVIVAAVTWAGARSTRPGRSAPR